MQNTVANEPGLDPTLPNVELVMKGNTYQLVYDFNAVVQAEKITGANLLAAVTGNLDAISLRGLLWAALLKTKPKITMDEVGEMITPSNLAVIHNAIITAWFGSVKDEAVGEAEAQGS
jgi:ubiquinone biosynthesis protein UbiJ